MTGCHPDGEVVGPVDDLLFPIHHGILYYPGIDVLPPFVLYGTDRMSDEDYLGVAKAWEQRLLILESTEPIAFRPQNFGDYEIPSLHLKEGLARRPHGLRAARARLTTGSGPGGAGGPRADRWQWQPTIRSRPRPPRSTRPARTGAESRRQDLDAVTAGLTPRWNSGPVKGHVNRITYLTRQGHGRASFALLRRRILLATRAPAAVTIRRCPRAGAERRAPCSDLWRSPGSGGTRPPRTMRGRVWKFRAPVATLVVRPSVATVRIPPARSGLPGVRSPRADDGSARPYVTRQTISVVPVVQPHRARAGPVTQPRRRPGRRGGRRCLGRAAASITASACCTRHAQCARHRRADHDAPHDRADVPLRRHHTGSEVRDRVVSAR
ncbi:hypothetical protein GCM10025734_83010 [Kitasatospora paranensis]